jgi:hypothetical protein
LQAHAGFGQTLDRQVEFVSVNVAELFRLGEYRGVRPPLVESGETAVSTISFRVPKRRIRLRSKSASEPY